jgi:DNA-binding CsgD family transcriptional regulator
LAKFGVGVPHTSIDVFGSIENVQKEYGDYYGFLQKWGMTSQLGALLDYGDFRWSVLGIHRPAEMGVFDKNTSTFLQHITIHIRRALQIHRQLTAVQHHNNQLYRMLDGLVAGIILVNTTGKVRYANARAEYLLKRHGALQLCPKNGLHAVHLGQNQTLQSLLQGAIRTGQRENSVLTGGVIGLQRTLGETPLMLTVTPLSQLSGYKELASDGVAAAIFLTNPDGSHTLSRKLLQQSYGLTERESELCNAFVNQATLEGAAESCGLSLASVRTYLKAIYEKTGQHSQAELMRLLMGLRVDFEHIR